MQDEEFHRFKILSKAVLDTMEANNKTLEHVKAIYGHEITIGKKLQEHSSVLRLVGFNVGAVVVWNAVLTGAVIYLAFFRGGK